jgi:hypothetical protein
VANSKMLKRFSPDTHQELIRIELTKDADLLLTSQEYAAAIERGKREQRGRRLTEKTSRVTLRNNDGNGTQTDSGAARLEPTEVSGRGGCCSGIHRAPGDGRDGHPGIIGAVDPDHRGASKR